MTVTCVQRIEMNESETAEQRRRFREKKRPWEDARGDEAMRSKEKRGEKDRR